MTKLRRRAPNRHFTAMPITTMVLAAGHGTRLRPLTLDRPKPLLEVLGRPLAAFALDHAHRIRSTRAILNTHHLGAKISRHFQNSYRRGQRSLPLSYSRETKLLGTGGGLRKMWQRLLLDGDVEGPVLILNADALIDLDTAALASKFFQHSRSATQGSPLSVMVLKSQPDAHRYGLIKTDARGRVIHFAGRADAPGDHVATRERMFCGVHLVDPSLFDMVPPPPYGDDGVCINRAGYPPAIASGEEVRSVDHRGIFWDVGTPERLLEANLRLLGGHDRLRHLDPFIGLELCSSRLNPSVVTSTKWAAALNNLNPFSVPPRLRRIIWTGKGVKIHPDATIIGPVLLRDGAVVGPGAQVGPYAVVGENARVGAKTSLSFSVLLSRAATGNGRRLRGEIIDKVNRAVVDDVTIENFLAKTSNTRSTP